MWKRILLGIAIILLSLQLIRMPANQGPAPGSDDLIVRTAPDPAILQLLQNACYDCHSDQTRYPWYAAIQPVGWWVYHHIKEGKRGVNLSRIGSLPPGKAANILKECAGEIEEGEMPLSSYRLLHPGARLTPAQRKLLSDWFGLEAAKLSPE